MVDEPRRVVALVPFDLWELIVQHSRESDDLHLRVLVERAVTKTIAENLLDVPMQGDEATS